MLVTADDVASIKARVRARSEESASVNPFLVRSPPPGVVPEDGKLLANDSQITAVSGWAGHGAGYYGYAFGEGLAFLGYPYLAELAQRPEYRRIVEVIATEMTRKWIRLTSKDESADSEKIKAIEGELERLNVRAAFRKVAEQDGFFGRGHLFINLGDDEQNSSELASSIGNGNDKTSARKVGKGSLKAVTPVEATWTYPSDYNSINPLKPDWYRPSVWFVMGTRVHHTRLLTFIGREVPDMLKPAYFFGGLSLTQMAKPYVDNWLQTRQSVNDIITSFTTWVLKTNMSAQLQKGGEALYNRAEIFNELRNNRGLMMVDKNEEEFANVAVALSDLDKLQAQSQEHMASVSGIPLVKLLGIQPAGLNATADGEIRVFYDWVHAYQEALFHANLTKVLQFVQLSLFGEIDDDIGFEFETLWDTDEREKADIEKVKAETGQVLIDAGVISPDEERKRVANDPDSSYQGLDPDDAPDLHDEEEEGLEPKGGRPIDKLFEGAVPSSNG